jgi:hypothetical protein
MQSYIRNVTLADAHDGYERRGLGAEARRQRRTVDDQLRERFPKIGTLMDKAEVDVLADLTFSKAYRVQTHSTIPWSGLMRKSNDILTLSGSSRTKR